MENYKEIIEFAPVIVVLLLFIWQNNIFVKPEQLEKKHREILNDVQKQYVELNAYKEFQNHVIREFETVKQDMNKGFADIKELLMKYIKDEQ